jgi:uncharacterized membrane protein
MNIQEFVKLYLVTVPVFFLIDMLWLGVISKNFYQKKLGFLLSPQVNWTAAIIFYLLFIVGIIIFAVSPGLEANSIQKTLIMGALFGFFTYATYDLSNLATIKDWPLVVTIVDILWGTTLSTLVASASFYLGKLLGIT